MKIAVIFPGIGYHKDKPLLYYASRLAKAEGYVLLNIEYGVIPSFEREDTEAMEKVIRQLIMSSKEQLKDMEWSKYDHILFISKSIGTVVASAIASQMKQRVGYIGYTPLIQTFAYPIKNGIIFHGTQDPWAKTESIQNLCKKQELPLFLTKGANHSLEQEDPLENINVLKQIMQQTKAYMTNNRSMC